MKEADKISQNKVYCKFELEKLKSQASLLLPDTSMIILNLGEKEREIQESIENFERTLKHAIEVKDDDSLNFINDVIEKQEKIQNPELKLKFEKFIKENNLNDLNQSMASQ